MKMRFLPIVVAGALVGSCSKPSDKKTAADANPAAEAKATEAKAAAQPAAADATTADAKAPESKSVPQVVAFASPFMEKLAPHLLQADGKPVVPADVAPAKQTLLYFSASWCGPCKQFTPQLVEKYQLLRDAGIQVVLANRDQTRDKMLAYMTSHSQPWPGLPPEIQNDKTIDLSGFTERGIPSMALIASDGTLVKKGIAWTLLPEILKDLPAK